LKFTDDGNGTGSISGTANQPGTAGCITIDGRAGCGIIASSSQGTVIQGLVINLAPSPEARLGPPTDAAFIAGASNSIELASTGAQTNVSWQLRSAPPWMALMDNGDGTATLLGYPPVGTSGTFDAEIAPIAAGSNASVNPVFTSFPVKVADGLTFLSPDTATFTVGSEGSFAISANEGNIDMSGTLPAGLSFSGGNPASITGTPVAGSGGQYTVNVSDSLRNGVSIHGTVTLDVYEAPSIISPANAILPIGLPGSITVLSTGFPSVSPQPVAQPLTPPTSPQEGKGMFFTVSGLPIGLKASNLDPEGNATGTLTIEGTPRANDVGLHRLQITARNGVGETAGNLLTLRIVNVESVPASTAGCDGAYNGVFEGNLGVGLGENCMFVGGGVRGNVTVIGGNFTLSHALVTGNVQVQGWSQFSMSPDSAIFGDLTIEDVAGVSHTTLCGISVSGNVSVLDNGIPIEVGSPQASCAENFLAGNLAINNNSDPIDVYKNLISGALGLSCTNNNSIAGAANFAVLKEGQCAAF
jgi:Putative Ig domain